MVIPSYPFRAEFIDIASSGAEVPNATNVKAIMNGWIFKCLAKEVDPLTNQLPLKYNIAMPIIK